MKDSIFIETRIAIILSQKATRNSLTMIVDLFQIGLSKTSKIVQECCEGSRIFLRV